MTSEETDVSSVSLANKNPTSLFRDLPTALGPSLLVAGSPGTLLFHRQNTWDVMPSDSWAAKDLPDLAVRRSCIAVTENLSAGHTTAQLRSAAEFVEFSPNEGENRGPLPVLADLEIKLFCPVPHTMVPCAASSFCNERLDVINVPGNASSHWRNGIPLGQQPRRPVADRGTPSGPVLIVPILLEEVQGIRGMSLTFSH